MRFGKLEMDPALSPAILDTVTWDREAAWTAVQRVDEAFWPALAAAAAGDAPWPAVWGVTPHAPSFVRHEAAWYGLAGLADGQQVFLALGPVAGTTILGEPIGVKEVPGGGNRPGRPDEPGTIGLALHPTDAPVIDRFFRIIAPDKGPQALDAVPRLGIGTRMTTAVWPAIWEAMAKGGFAANAIQNSVRELNFLEDLLHGRPAEKNIAFSFGTIETGYTGSSFEGLWVAGVLDALKYGAPPRYGADADHIQVKRGRDGLARARRMLDATRYYTFYTLDVSDVLDYAALSAGPAAGIALLDSVFSSAIQRSQVVAFHRQPRRIGGFDYALDEASLGRLAGKYWAGLDAVGELYETICAQKRGASFDLELSIDEHPNDVPTFECLTSETELVFVLLEAQRRGIPLTHVAPNFGVEKGTDYRGADGLPGFETRARSLWRIAEELGVMADFHSGDDLSAATRQAIGRATEGRNHFKVSPNLQLLFAEVLAEYHPDLFQRWWEDALSYAMREAAAGSRIAAECIRLSGGRTPSAHDAVFHHFSFAFVGRRDADGQFVCREEFYNLSPAFYGMYQQRLVEYLSTLASDLFDVE